MSNNELDYEIVIVGAGISGIGAGIFLQKANFNSFVLLESEEELGGTWRDNTYPGVAVDIPSLSYCYSFEPYYKWSRAFAPGAEIQEYVQHCARKYGIREKIQFNSKVSKIEFDENKSAWTTYLKDGRQLKSRYVIAATGILNQPKYPEINGIDQFKGKMMHSARWDHHYDLTNKKVAIIGTGASAVQIVPSIADQVAHLSVFQRTPIWVGPKRDYLISEERQHRLENNLLLNRLARFTSEATLEAMTFVITNYQQVGFIAEHAENLQRNFIKHKVKDSILQDKLTPQYGFGCKRPAISNDYFKTFNRGNVALITERIDSITETGIKTCDGVEYELDAIILATGFKTMEKGNSPSFAVYGLDGIELSEEWDEGRYQAYRSISVPDFPNFFLTFGPYGGGLNWFAMLEANLTYVVRCLKEARRKQANYLEVKRNANDRYFQKMLKKGKTTVFTKANCAHANSYYFDKHGDVSLPAPYTPMWRWFGVRFSSLRSYQFK